VFVPHAGKLPPGQAGKILAAEDNFAFGGRIQASKEMQQSAFAGSGSAAQSQEIAAIETHIDSTQDLE
jgi:hypothetical protein